MIRVFLADDHALVRSGLARVISEVSDLRVVGEATTSDELLAAAPALETDVVLLDVSMPGPDFISVIQQLRSSRSDIKVLVLSMHAESLYAKRALQAGAAGYLSKDRSSEELISAIRRVAAGGRYVTAELAQALAAELDPQVARSLHDALSEREFQVLRLIGQGKAVGDIASALTLSPKTVSTYRVRILEKLGLETTADLIRYAIEHDIGP